ncbi:MAG: queuosine precursor transporter [Paludibacter sp.]|jgi:uncharacterized integral membrane protein (TIGR00697 family)|nr:queuosine precursor transporter [Paludibacter sp.]
MKKTVSVPFMALGLLFACSLIISNIIEQKFINIGRIEATAALLIFPISYIINDLITEVWGYRKARLIIWSGFAMNFFAVAMFQLAIIVPGSENFTHQEAFAKVLGTTTLRISIASFIAFLCGSFFNAYVMSRMKILQHGRGFSIRAIVSTMAGEGVDSLLFFALAFYGVIPNNALITLIFTQMGMKTAYEIVALPFTNILVRQLKKHEQTDVYDKGVSYNPLKINEI